LDSAGFLIGKRAATHPNTFDELKPCCAAVVDRRVVDEGEVVTARGVSASMDLGLHLFERLADGQVRVKIANQMDSPYAPLSQ
jgi:cyclohexyl-isocyanide hydratase